MTLAEITLLESAACARQAEPVRMGIPLAPGAVNTPAQLSLLDGGQPLPLDARATQHWPDGSVRWCLLDTVVAISADAKKALTLQVGQPRPAADGVRVEAAAEAGHAVVDTGAQRFQVGLESLSVSGADNATLSAPFLTLASGAVAAQVRQFEWSATAAQARLELLQTGDYCDAAGQLLCHFESRLAFFAGSGQVHWSFALHNPRAASHPGGLWDLGDPASMRFLGLSFTVQAMAPGAYQLQREPNEDWLPVRDRLSLLQASSGGQHWNSRNHVDSQGEVPLAFSGYRLDADANTTHGERADPVLRHSAGLALYVDRFWQNFPKGIEVAGGVATIELFPQRSGYAHELQPGERKTHHLCLDFSAAGTTTAAASVAHLRSPVQVQIPAAYVASTGAVQHFAPDAEPLDALIQGVLDPATGFAAKREIIDEYGWRHFGDIFADHESLYLPPGERFISHYNNQYDPLYGMLRQYLLTGDPAWKTMADELAWHIGDIDIYSTTEDRAEYNGGLFWHTDHYVDAFTASHRTYSRHQKPNGQDMTQGGGPGAEHCYTHGLMLHYSLTGCERSRQAVLQLTHWIGCFYEGSGGIVEALLDLKGRVLPRVQNASDPSRILDHRYPFNRGVGNYLNGLLDSLALTGESAYLAQAQRVIEGTFSPLDEVADRHLDDVEITWFYTIFLQAVARFLEVKKQAGEWNQPECQAIVAGYMKYARWMAEHDQPYLNRPDILEYPNDTWAAQDIRKACVLYYATQYASTADERAQLLARANEFYQYVCDALGQSDTRHFSRILAILMQNHGVHGYFAGRVAQADQGLAPPLVVEEGLASPYRNRTQILAAAVKAVMKAILKVSVRRELSWLKHRHSAFAKLHDRLYGRRAP